MKVFNPRSQIMVLETVCLAIPDESLSLHHVHTNLSYLTVINTSLLANYSVGEMQCLCVHWHLMKRYLNDSLPSPLLFFFFPETGFYSPLTPDILGPACQVLVSWPVPLCPQDEHSAASVRGRLTHLPVATVLLLPPEVLLCTLTTSPFLARLITVDVHQLF